MQENTLITIISISINFKNVKFNLMLTRYIKISKKILKIKKR